MHYDSDYFHEQLIMLQNLDYERYKKCTEFDVLISQINSEEIYDFYDVDWWCFIDRFLCISENPHAFHGKLFIIEDKTLEKSCKLFTNRGVRIKFLLLLQRNEQEILRQFENPDFLEKECARLISHEIQESAKDQYHGAYANMPRPNYAALIQEPDILSKKTYIRRWEEKMEQEYAKQYEQQTVQSELLLDLNANAVAIIYRFVDDCSDSSNYCPTLVVIQEATEQYNAFLSSNGANADAWKYIDAIYEKLKTNVNSEYWRKTPAYQVMAVLYVMLLTKPNPTLEQLSFANNIGKVVFSRDNFAGTKEMADEAVRLIMEAKQQFDGVKEDAKGKTLIEILDENKHLSNQLKNLKKLLKERPTNDEVTNLKMSIKDLQDQLAKYKAIDENYIAIDNIFAEASKIDDPSQLAIIKNFLHALELNRQRINALRCATAKLNIEQLNMGSGTQTKILPNK